MRERPERSARRLAIWLCLATLPWTGCNLFGGYDDPDQSGSDTDRGVDATEVPDATGADIGEAPESDTGSESCRGDADASLASPMRGRLYARRIDPGTIATDGDFSEFGDR